MQFVGKMLTSVSEFYKDINPSTLSGAIDVIVVEDASNNLSCSPFHVRFGKLQLLRPQEKIVEMRVNGEVVAVPMKVGEAGETFFVLEAEEGVTEEYLTSPLVGPIPGGPVDKLDLVLPSAEFKAGVGDGKKSASNFNLEVKSDGEELEDGKASSRSALSDSEVEINSSEPIMMASSPTKYSWMWGGLPKRQQSSNATTTSLKALETTKPPSSTEMEMETKERRVELELFEHFDNLKVFTENYEAFAKVEGIDNVKLFSTETEKILPLPEDPGSMIVEFIKYNMTMIDAADDLDFDLQEVLKTTAAKVVGRRYLIVINDSIIFNGQVGCMLLLSRTIFGKLPSLEYLLQKYPQLKSDHVTPIADILEEAITTPLPPSPINEPASSSSSSANVESTKDIRYRKSLRLPDEMLKELNLKDGMNTVSFTVTTRLQGIATCTARIFKWRHDTRIVISDVDGTITKSDALGHLFTFVGKDWTHSGIANLYTNITKNGYHFVYLTSRSLGQANSTRGYLKAVEQDKYQLPDGPVIMSPDRLLAALRREVVLGNPQEFKIACLKDIRDLFVPHPGDTNNVDIVNPFYAGFGNRTNDAHAYLATGIPPQRIFIINPSGTVSIEPLADQYPCSYGQLLDLVDSIFPPRECDKRGEAPLEEPFNEFWYWRRPMSLGNVLPLQTSGGDVGIIKAVMTVDKVTNGSESTLHKDSDDESTEGEEEAGLVPAYYI